MTLADIAAFLTLAISIGALVYKAGKNARDVDNLGRLYRSLGDREDRRYKRFVAYLQRQSGPDDKDEVARLIREDRID